MTLGQSGLEPSGCWNLLRGVLWFQASWFSARWFEALLYCALGFRGLVVWGFIVWSVMVWSFVVWTPVVWETTFCIPVVCGQMGWGRAALRDDVWGLVVL